MAIAPFDLYTSTAQRPSRVVSRPRVQVGRQALVVTAEIACVFALAIVSTYGLSVLTGKSLSEKARLDAGSFEMRSRLARGELSGLQQRYEMRANPRRIGDWARANGFERDGTLEASQ